MTRKISVLVELLVFLCLFLSTSNTTPEVQAQEGDKTTKIYLPVILKDTGGQNSSVSQPLTLTVIPTPIPPDDFTIPKSNAPQLQASPLSEGNTQITPQVLSSSATGETLTVPFTNGTAGVQTSQSYQGIINVTVSGFGQAAGTAFSDAFYIFTDQAGNPITPVPPPGPFNFTLWINGGPADNFVQPIPPFNVNHLYTFQINAPGGPLTFAVGDTFTSDNTGAFTVTVERFLSDTQLIAKPIGDSVVPFIKQVAGNYVIFYNEVRPALNVVSAASFGICTISIASGAPVGCLLTFVNWAVFKESLIITFEKISADPPSEDFDQVFELKPIEPFEPVDDSPFSQAWANFQTRLAEFNALLEAYRVTLERVQGAIEADEVTFVILQAEALTEFNELLIKKIRRNYRTP